MTRTVYIPHDLAQACYLNEALLWVALGRFPLAWIGTHGLELRQETDLLDGDLLPPIWTEPVSPEECARSGIPPNPEWDLIKEGTSPPDLEFLRGRLRQKGIHKEVRPRWERELQKAEAWHQRQVEWDAEFHLFLDRSKSRLFLALAEGKVTAIGIQLPESTYQGSIEYLKKHGPMNWPDWVPIPAHFWISHRIDWTECWAEGKNSAFCLILIPFEELSKSFPAEAEKADGGIRTGEVFAPPSQGKVHRVKGRTPGRPPTFDWDSFHVEVARRLLSENGELPEKQEAFIAEMLEWCKSKRDKPPSRSAVFQRVKPYYDAFAPKVRKSRHKNF